MRQLHAGQVPEQHTMSMQRAFGFPVVPEV
jgi:hypothetical protein